MDVEPGVPTTIDKSVDPRIRKKIEEDGWSNLDLMKNGNAPIGPDGKYINLHHVTGDEPGPMVELTGTVHKKYHKELHGTIEDGDSFRNDPKLELQYSKFRKAYWKERAKDFE
nr:HNH/ENDO VII family nuclease [Pseudomonas fluorescens]